MDQPPQPCYSSLQNCEEGRNEVPPSASIEEEVELMLKNQFRSADLSAIASAVREAMNECKEDNGRENLVDLPSLESPGIFVQPRTDK
jgi:hypothetical protein